ncbi:MAG: rod shape-determining protein, partial [Verrucomicrobiota bacterium]
MAVYRKTDDSYSDPNEEDRQLPMHTGDYQPDPEEAQREGGEGFKLPQGLKMPQMPSMDSLKGLIKGVNTMFDDIVIALGSENVYVASREQPEPTSYAAYVAITKANNQVIALGDKARAMVGREPENIEVIRVL